MNTPDAAPAAPTVTETAVLEALREVIDPELGMNLVDLGLIYNVNIQGTYVGVEMTLTTPGCPMHDRLAHGAKVAVLRLDGVEEVDVEIVWDPPWAPTMMTAEARAQLGW